MADRAALRPTDNRSVALHRADRANRAVVPAVGKLLEIGLVVMFVGLLAAVLFGSAVPRYQTAADAELGERVLATAGQEIERAVPPRTRDASVRHRVDLPATIGDSDYELRVDGRTLVLDHPSGAVSGQMRLALSPRVDRIDGEWQSGSDLIVTVSGGDGLVIELAEGEP